MNENKKLKVLVWAALTLLIFSEVSLSVHQSKWVSLPYSIYSLSYYLRAAMAIACIFFGVFDAIVGKERESAIGKYYLIFMGLGFTFLAIAPSVTGLYFSTSINPDLRSIDLIEHLNNQKTYLVNVFILFCTYFLIFLAVMKSKK